MIIDEAIKQAEEKAKELKEKSERNIIEVTKEGVICLYDGKEYEDCLECAKEHEQLAGWLEELKELRSFAEFVTREVLDEDFEDCSGAFAEIACRKLVKLGYVVLDGDTYKRGNENDNSKT